MAVLLDHNFLKAKTLLTQIWRLQGSNPLPGARLARSGSDKIFNEYFERSN